jgi:hypothetical protein
LQKQPKMCTKRYFILPPAKIHLLRFMLEGYEGIGLVTTLDAALGMIELSVAPGCEEEMALILTAEGGNLELRPVW